MDFAKKLSSEGWEAADALLDEHQKHREKQDEQR